VVVASMRRWGPIVLGLVLAFAVIQVREGSTLAQTPRSLLGPSDSLRLACHELPKELSGGVRGVRLLARPSVTFYLAGRVAVQPQADLDALLQPGDPALWAVADFALLGKGGEPDKAKARLLERWELVREWKTELNVPTLLDIHPEAAR